MKTDFSGGVAGAVGAGVTTPVKKARAFLGFSCAESSGAASAELRLHDGADATGPLLAVVTLAANESEPLRIIPEGGEDLTNGKITLEVVSGSVRGVIYWA